VGLHGASFVLYKHWEALRRVLVVGLGSPPGPQSIAAQTLERHPWKQLLGATDEVPEPLVRSALPETTGLSPGISGRERIQLLKELAELRAQAS
jgi:hypothetical protein